MSFSYDQAAALYKMDDLDTLASDDGGLRYLLVKTLMRREYAEELDTLSAQTVSSQGVTAWPRLVFDSGATTAAIEAAIERLYKSERAVRLAPRRLDCSVIQDARFRLGRTSPEFTREDDR